MSELWIKDEKVLTLKDIEGVPGDILKIDNPELLPVCLKDDCTMDTFKKWLDGRNIPDNREGLAEIKEEFGDKWLKNKNYASLSDHYWIKMRTESWKRINFFTNTYSRDIGDMVFMPWSVNKRIDSFSPDLTTNGILKKRWTQNADKTSSLIKAGSKITKQEPLNEVLVSVLIEQLDLPYLKSAGYDLHVEGTTMCSITDNFIDLNTELVPAHYIYFKEKRSENESVYTHLIKMCELYDIPDAEDFINALIFVDNVTGNEDRNLNNIGFIMDVKTRKFIGPSPVYDCGNAYWNTKNVNDPVKSKLFSDMEEIVFKKLKKKFKLDDLIESKGYKKIIWDYPCISEEKKENLCKAIDQRNLRLSRESNVLDIDR